MELFVRKKIFPTLGESLDSSCLAGNVAVGWLDGRFVGWFPGCLEGSPVGRSDEDD